MNDANDNISQQIPVGVPIDDFVTKRLAEMGLDEGDIGMVTEGGAGLHDSAWRWRLCPVCKSNIDMMTFVEGEQDQNKWPRILPTGMVECPNCGCSGNRFGKLAENQPHEKLATYEARQIHNPYPWVAKYVSIGASVVEELGLFPADPALDADEPHWPRDLAAAIIGAAIVVSSTIKKQGERFDPSKVKPASGKGRGTKDKGWNRGRRGGPGGIDSRGNKR